MKPTINEIEKAKEIVNELIENDFFDAIICEDNELFYNWCDEYRTFFKAKGIEFHCGESKACIVSKELINWVIKVGFVDYDKETKTHTTDFCSIEAANFKDAVEEGLQEFFAASYELTKITPPEKYNYGGYISFYIQERAEPDEEKTSNTCEEYTGSDWNEDEDRVESLFGKFEKIKELLEFLDDWSINDLHSGNFGYTANGMPKIIDYSGYL